MANTSVKITELPLANSFSNTDLLLIVQNTASNAITHAVEASLILPTGAAPAGLPYPFQVGLPITSNFTLDSSYSTSNSSALVPYNSVFPDGVQYSYPTGYDPQSVYNLNANLPYGKHDVIPAFVAPVAGIYWFHATINFGPTNDRMVGDIGYSTMEYSIVAANSTGGIKSVMSAIDVWLSNKALGVFIEFNTEVSGAAELNAGDIVYTVATVKDGANGNYMYINSFESYLSGMQIQ
jgi:hypothetical protein